MADENIFDKAENLARRVFERLGAKVDAKLAPDKESIFSQREVTDLIAKLERAIDANLKADSKGTKRVAPHCFKVLVTYERTPRLNLKYVESLAGELKATAFEYIANRRYETRGPIRVVIARDFFEKSVAVKASFDEKELQTLANDLIAPRGDKNQAAEEKQKISGLCNVRLRNVDGQSFHFELKASAAPISIGRAAGNRVRIDDASVSRQHCSISLRSDGQILIADLESANGTAVNGRFLNPNEAASLKAGDTILVGDIELEVAEIA